MATARSHYRRRSSRKTRADRRPGLRAGLRFAASFALLFSVPAASATAAEGFAADLEVSSVTMEMPPPPAPADQAPIQVAERSEEELLILRVTLGDFILSEGLFGYPNQGSLLLPLTDIVSILEFPIEVDAENGRAEGWFLSENRLFTLDLAARQAVIEGEVLAVAPGLVEQQPDDIYVDVRTLARWFPVDFDFDLPNLILDITSREPLPLEARLAREDQRERMLAQTRRERRDLPEVEVPYKWITWPVSDTIFDIAVNGGEGETEITRSYTTLATADLVKLNADFFISGTQDDQVAVARLKLGRRNPNGNLLGALDATEFAVGDVFGPQITHVSRTRLGRGVTISNAPLDRETEFDSITLQGDLQLGWEVELYRNEVLLDFRQSQSDGRYLFEDVPLLFGVNVIKLVFYGPQGQRREEVRQIRIGPDQIKPGEHLYNVSFNQQDRLLLLGDDDAVKSDDFQGKNRYALEYKYGVNQNLSLGANLVSIPFERGHRNYLGTSLVTSLGPIYTRADVTKDVSGGWAGTLSAQTRLFGVSVLGEHTILNDFRSETYDNESDPLKSESRLRIDGIVDAGFLPRIPYAFNVSHDVNKSGDRSTSVQNRLSAAIGRASVSNTLSLTLNDPAQTEDSTSANGTVQIGGLIGPVRARGQVSYGLDPETAINSIALSGEWRLNRKLNARAGLSRELTGNQATNVTMGVNTDIDYVAVGVNGQVDDAGSYQAKMQLTYSWGKDAADGGLRIASKPTAERGTMTALVYRDWDGDGRYTEGVDEPLEGVGFVSGKSKLEQKTNDKGLAFVTNMETYDPVAFEVDEATLIDPFWVAAPEAVRVTLRPGVPGEIEFAVVSSGEIDGIVYRQKDGWAEPTSDVIVQLVDAAGSVVKETRSQYDGFFLLDFIRPGTYTLRIDPEQISRLELPPVPSRIVEIGKDGTILNGEDFVIGGDPADATAFRVRLAAFADTVAAEAAWAEINAALPDLFADVEREIVVETPVDESKTVISLFAEPFPTRAAAEAACIDLRAALGNTWCNPLDIQVR